jgi:hypothetical protein
MATTTHRIAVTAEAYTNVSNGNFNCTLVNGNNAVRLVISGIEPAADTVDCVVVSGAGVIFAQQLEAEDEMWIRAESADADIVVIRGPALVTLTPH